MLELEIGRSALATTMAKSAAAAMAKAAANAITMRNAGIVGNADIGNCVGNAGIVGIVGSNVATTAADLNQNGYLYLSG